MDKLIHNGSTYYFNGIPCEELDKDFEIKTDNKIGEVNDYPWGSYEVYLSPDDNRTYIFGITLSGVKKIVVCNEFYS